MSGPSEPGGLPEFLSTPKAHARAFAHSGDTAPQHRRRRALVSDRSASQVRSNRRAGPIGITSGRVHVMAVRMRKNVWTLPTGDQTLDWYAKAIDVLIKRPITDPTSWRYMAAVHDVPATLSTPSSAQGSWAQCQHQSWFFLPWHRGYITAATAHVEGSGKVVHRRQKPQIADRNARPNHD